MNRGWRTAQELLCVRLDGIGDVLMATPAVRALREGLPAARITMLTSPAGAEAARHVPEIDDVLVYEAAWMKATPTRPDAAPDRAIIDCLRSRGFDAAVIFTAYSQSPLPAALMAYLAGIPLRLAHCHENPYQLLTDWVPDPEPGGCIRHEVERQLALIGAIGCRARDTRLSFRVQPAEALAATTTLREAGIDPARPFAVVHPGGTAESRRYSAGHMATLAAALAHELPVVVTGSDSEAELAEAVAGGPGSAVVSLAGRLGLGELASVIERAGVVVTGNTGPAHLAAAVGTPVVVIYALTNPQHTPWGVPSAVLYRDVPCRFCYRSVCSEGHHGCVDIPPGEVAEAALRLLADPSSPPAMPVAVVGGAPV